MDWVAVGSVSGAVVAAGVVLTFVWRHLAPRLMAVRQFWEHLVGVAANPVTGQEEVRGLFQRLDSQDTVLRAQSVDLDVIRHELFPNSGLSFRDDHDRLKDTVDGLAADLRKHLDDCPRGKDTP